MNTTIFPNSIYLDFHTHKIKNEKENDIIEILSLDIETNSQHSFYTIGKHPWNTKHILPKEKDILWKHLVSESCLALGEVGLDKLKGASMLMQMEILRSQLEIAQELNMPVIIHCVKAFEELLKIKKEYPKIQKWCVHGFSKNKILAQQLISQGFYLSFCPVSEKQQEILASLPIEKIFLETDDFNLDIKDLYLSVANTLGISMNALKKQISTNAKLFFEK